MSLRVAASADQDPAKSDYFVSISSPHLVGLPADEASTRLLAAYMAVRLMASLAEMAGRSSRHYADRLLEGLHLPLFFPSHPHSRFASGTPGDAQALVLQAVASLGLAQSDPGFALGGD